MTSDSLNFRTNSDRWTLVRGARQLLTLHHHGGARRGAELSGLGLIADGSLLIRDGMIEAVGPTRRIENLSGARHADEINAAGRVVMPAFVDSTACLTPVPAHRQENSRSVQALPASRLQAQTGELLKTMARHGTATIGGLTGNGVDTTGELKILRTMHALNHHPLDIVSVLLLGGPGADPTLSAEEFLSTVWRRKLAGIAAVLCGENGLSRADAETLLQTARSHGFAVRLELLPDYDPQLLETAVHQQALSVTLPGPCPEPAIQMLSGSATFAILLPQGLAQTGRPVSARPFVDRGALIALGTGLKPDTGATASMQTVVQQACTGLGLSLAEAILAATVNAAWALGVGAKTGTLEHGKQADLILLNVSDYRDIPLFAGTNLTHMLLKRGVILFKEDFPGWPVPD